MKTKKLLWIISLAIVVISSGYTVMSPNGAPAGQTGSPGDGSNCTSCHGGTATTTAGKITSNIPVTGYVPGTTYQITATNPITGSGKMGFEVSPQDATGAQKGILVAGTGSHLVGGTKYITHTSANATTSTWTFGWTAPVAGSGAVTFYGAFARRQPGPVTLSTLVVQEAAAVPGAAGPITGPNTVCNGNTATYSVGVIAGATSYVWSVPTGATISGGQGTTSINVSFGASSVSGDVSVYGSNGAGNGAASNLAVTVNTVPSAPTTPDGPSDVDLFSVTSSNFTTSAGADTYEWLLSPVSAGTISGTTTTATVTWNLSFTGNAEVSVKGSNACGLSVSSTAKVVVVRNTTSVSDPNAIHLLSTVSNGVVTLDLNSNSPFANVLLFDISGKILLNTKIAGQGIQQLDVQLKPGVYFIAVEAGSSTIKKKIMVI